MSKSMIKAAGFSAVILVGGFAAAAALIGTSAPARAIPVQSEPWTPVVAGLGSDFAPLGTDSGAGYSQ